MKIESGNEILTLESLGKEYSMWIKNYGDKRNKQNIRFGQYIWIKYDLTNITFNGLDGFYSESAQQAFDIFIKRIK